MDGPLQLLGEGVDKAAWRKSHCHHMTFLNIVCSGGNRNSRDSGRCGEGALKFMTAMKTICLPPNFPTQMLLQMHLCAMIDIFIAINADDILHILVLFQRENSH